MSSFLSFIIGWILIFALIQLSLYFWRKKLRLQLEEEQTEISLHQSILILNSNNAAKHRSVPINKLLNRGHCLTNIFKDSLKDNSILKSKSKKLKNKKI